MSKNRCHFWSQCVTHHPCFWTPGFLLTSPFLLLWRAFLQYFCIDYAIKATFTRQHQVWSKNNGTLNLLHFIAARLNICVSLEQHINIINYIDYMSTLIYMEWESLIASASASELNGNESLSQKKIWYWIENWGNDLNGELIKWFSGHLLKNVKNNIFGY